jgi:cytochrome b subunit of formate dehydrogenase
MAVWIEAMIVSAVAGFVNPTVLRHASEWRKRIVEPTRVRKRQRLPDGPWAMEY